MKNNKEKNLKQIGTIMLIILLTLIGYVISPNENEVLNNISTQKTQTNTVNTVNTNIENIPRYSGQIVININNDVPYFEDKDITTEDFEIYSVLDEFDRAGVAFANICKYTMPKERNKKRKPFI